jgi:thiol-disulfide isomerase/thioredoxin
MRSYEAKLTERVDHGRRRGHLLEFRRFAAGALLAAVALVVTPPAATAGAVLQPFEAPEWETSEWLDGNPGKLADHRGRVVLIHFFQLWCPVSNTFSVPLFQRWQERYGANDAVLIVGIHTVFEGHAVQGPAALRRYVAEQGITYPVGIDAYGEDDPITPTTMLRYANEGTPQVAIVDKQGQLRFSHFGKFEPLAVEDFIGRLLKETGPSPRAAKPAGARRDEALSGRYRITLTQNSKTCGRLAAPLTTQADLTVGNGRVQARFHQAFLGMHDLEAPFDPATGRFETQAVRRATEAGVSVNLALELEGRFKRDARPAEFEYRFALDKEGDSPGAECRIEGSGKGVRESP